MQLQRHEKKGERPFRVIGCAVPYDPMQVNYSDAVFAISSRMQTTRLRPFFVGAGRERLFLGAICFLGAPTARSLDSDSKNTKKALNLALFWYRFDERYGMGSYGSLVAVQPSNCFTVGMAQFCRSFGGLW